MRLALGGVLGSVVLEDLPELVSIDVQQQHFGVGCAGRSPRVGFVQRSCSNSLSGLVLPFLPKLTSLTASYNQLTSVVLESSKQPALEYSRT